MKKEIRLIGICLLFCFDYAISQNIPTEYKNTIRINATYYIFPTMSTKTLHRASHSYYLNRYIKNKWGVGLSFDFIDYGFNENNGRGKASQGILNFLPDQIGPSAKPDEEKGREGQYLGVVFPKISIMGTYRYKNTKEYALDFQVGISARQGDDFIVAREFRNSNGTSTIILIDPDNDALGTYLGINSIFRPFKYVELSASAGYDRFFIKKSADSLYRRATTNRFIFNVGLGVNF